MSIRKVWPGRASFIRNWTELTSAAMSTGHSPKILPDNTAIEEETAPGYDPKLFYPANPGELFNSRYKLIAKIGWGTTSTVWLAQDTKRWRWKPNRYVTLKIIASDPTDIENARHERIITQHLEKNPAHPGFPYVRTLADVFETPGPCGPHLCLIYEPMREPLWLFRHRWANDVLPPVLVKIYVRLLLKGLDYLHSECEIVHTDLKLDNILVGFENPSVIEDFVQGQAENPMPRKQKDGRAIYLSHNDFGPLKSYRIAPKIVDFGLAQSGHGSEPLLHPIQAHAFRAPEVLLGTSWSYSADIWNLGTLIWNMMEGKDLFRHFRSSEGEYSVNAHLGEMIALIGPPPKALIEREQSWSTVKWSQAVFNPQGKLSQTAREFYGGPFFDNEGKFLQRNQIPGDIRLEDTITVLEGEEKAAFLNFVKKMLQWLPEERKTAKELLEDPWLGGDHSAIASMTQAQR